MYLLGLKLGMILCSDEAQLTWKDGVINEDSSFAIDRILSQQTTKCINDKGVHIVPSVYLNSRGGYLRDGYKLGETFT